MFELSRRRLVVGSATAAAVFGLKGPMEFLPSALAQAGGSGQNANQNPTGMQFFKFKLGDIEVTQVFDGENVRKLAGDFVLNAPVDDVKKALVAGGLSGENIPISYTVTIIRAGGRTIMFDAGTAAAAQPAAGASAGKHESGRH